MISWHIDLGQIILAALFLQASVIVWFIKKEINTFGKRLDRHEEILFKLAQKVQIDPEWNGINERRKHKR